MADYSEAFAGIDVAKLRNAIAIADSGREGEVRFFGEVDASDQSMRGVIQRIAGRFDRVHFCYEAGPTGYGLYRLICSLGHECMVVAPSLIPRKPGDRVKTNRRDAIALARLLRAGELTAVPNGLFLRHRSRSNRHLLALINESSGNLWLLPSEIKDGSHFWLSKAEGRKQP